MRLDDSMTEATVNVSALRYRLSRAALVIPVVGSLAFAASCASDTVREGRGGSYLIIDALECASGADAQPVFSTVCKSDVSTGGGIFQDQGRVTMRIGLKDLGPVGSPTTPSTYNAITLSRFHVVYRRADGRNAPGVDVPFAFDGGMSMTVTDQPSQGVFDMVRVQAKLEAPLITLRGLGGALAISTLADVTFYGRDQAGNDVSATGTISVNFADWADPE
jgi:hypothetical protein